MDTTQINEPQFISVQVDDGEGQIETIYAVPVIYSEYYRLTPSQKDEFVSTMISIALQGLQSGYFDKLKNICEDVNEEIEHQIN